MRKGFTLLLAVFILLLLGFVTLLLNRTGKNMSGKTGPNFFNSPVELSRPQAVFNHQWEAIEIERAKPVNSAFSLDLYQSGDKIYGYHCATIQNGAKSDCFPNGSTYSIEGSVIGKKATITFQSSFSTDRGKAELSLENNQAVWKITQYPNGISYLPGDAVLVESCLKGSIPGELNNKFLTGKSFVNFATSGEWGTFEENGKLPVSWGTDYIGPNDTRPKTGSGNWKIGNNNLVISNSGLSDGVHTDFLFFGSGKNIFVVEKGLPFVIGPTKTLIQEFFDKNLYQNTCR